MKENKPKKAFDNWRHNSVHLTFPNGNSLSTIWGYLTYSDNHDWISGEDSQADSFTKWLPSNTVEIMILEAPDKLRKKIEKKYDFGGDSVKGYVTMKEWLEIVNLLAKETK